MVLNCFYLERIGGFDILWSVNKLARAVTKWTRACYRLCSFDFLEFITQITVDNIVMWVIRQTIVDWYCCKTQTLLETLKIRNQPRREFCVSSEVEHSFPYVWMCKKQTNFSLSQFNWIWSYLFGCLFAHGWYFRSRSKRCGDGSVAFFQEHTHSHQAVRVVLLPSGGHTPGDPVDSASSHLIPLAISGIWLLKWCIPPKTNQYKDTCCATKPKRNTPTPRRRNTSTGMTLNHSMWTTSPQTQNYLTLAPCITFLKI